MKENCDAEVLEVPVSAGSALENLDGGVLALGGAVGDRMPEQSKDAGQMGVNHLGHPLHRSEATGFDPLLPLVQEVAGAGRTGVIPEAAKLLLQGPRQARLELRSQEQGAQFAAAAPIQPLEPVQPKLATARKRFVAGSAPGVMFGPADLIDGFIGVADHMKRVIDDGGGGQFRLGGVLKRRPHVHADGPDSGALLRAESFVPKAFGGLLRPSGRHLQHPHRSARSVSTLT